MPASTRRIASPLLFKWESSWGLDSQNRLWALSGNRVVTATYDRGGTVGAASAVDANGRNYIPGYKTPRFHHQYNDTTGLFEPVGLLLEGARTNPFTYSQNFENAAWGKTAVTSCLLDATGPDGRANTANTLIASGATVRLEQISGTSLAAGQSGVVSVDFKVKTGAAYLVLGDIGDAMNHYAWFNLATGAVGTQTNCTATVETLGGGWFRGHVTYTATNTYNQRGDIYLSRTDNAFDAVATDSALIYGANGGVNIAFPSSYIPTTSAAVARSADALSFTFNPTPQALTWYAKFVEIGTLLAANQGIGSIGGTTGASIQLYSTGTVYRAFHSNGSGSVTSTAAAAPSRGDLVELRVVLAADGSITLGQSINGGAEAVAAASAANTPASAWNAATHFVGQMAASSNAGFAAFASDRIAAGVQTMATMRQL